MKNLLLSILVLTGLISCNKKPIVLDSHEGEHKPIETALQTCYMGVLKKDTISMTLNLKADQVSGDLSYNHFEKDKNNGKLEGIMKGDTLIADYIFMSEGVSSIRQVVFLRSGNTFTEGYGEVVNTENGKIMYKNFSDLNFDGKTILSKVDCKN